MEGRKEGRTSVHCYVTGRCMRKDGRKEGRKEKDFRMPARY